MAFSHPEIPKMFDSLANRFCERKALRCLHRFLPAYFVINGLTDGWESSVKQLKELRALCKNDLKEDELSDLRDLIALLDTILTKSEGSFKDLKLNRED